MVEKKTRKTKVNKEPVVVVEDASAEETVSAPRSYNGAKIIWGLLFIVIGTLILLGNLGVLEVDLRQLWQLWPLLIIMAGLSILALRGWLAVTISVIATVIILGLATAVATGLVNTNRDAVNESFNVTQIHQEIQKANVEINSGAGTLDVSSHGDRDVVKGSIESNVFKINKETSVNNYTQHVKLSLDGNSQWWRGNLSNSLVVQLNQTLPTSLKVNAGASDIKLDLSQVITEAVSIDSGATSVWLMLGDKQDISEVDIDTGVSSIEILVPKDSGVKIKIDGGLNSKNLPSDFAETSEGTYQSSNYDQSDRKINIVLDMGVSRMSLKTY